MLLFSSLLYLLVFIRKDLQIIVLASELDAYAKTAPSSSPSPDYNDKNSTFFANTTTEITTKETTGAKIDHVISINEIEAQDNDKSRIVGHVADKGYEASKIIKSLDRLNTSTNNSLQKDTIGENLLLFNEINSNTRFKSKDYEKEESLNHDNAIYSEIDASKTSQQQQYSSSRLLLRFLVITLFILLSLSLIIVYTIKLCLCHNKNTLNNNNNNNLDSNGRRRKPCRSFFAFNLRRCNLIADVPEVQAQQQQQSNIVSLLNAPTDMQLMSSLNHCSCFHPDIYSNNHETLNNHHSYTMAQAQRRGDIVWWCPQANNTPEQDPTMFYHQQHLSQSSSNNDQAVTNELPSSASSGEPTSSLATPSEIESANQQPPAYSDIYSSEITTSNEQNSISQLETIINCNSLYRHAAASSCSQARQKNLLVKLNLNKTRLLSPEDLMLLSRLIDVPIVVQQPTLETLHEQVNHNRLEGCLDQDTTTTASRADAEIDSTTEGS